MKLATGIWALEVRKCKGVCFGSFFCLHLVLAHVDPSVNMPCSLFALYINLTERQFGAQKKVVLQSQTHLDSILFLLLSHNVTVHLCFDFSEAVSMMVRA